MRTNRRVFVIALTGILIGTTSALAGIVPTPGPDGIVHLSGHKSVGECPPETAAAAAVPTVQTPIPVSEPAAPSATARAVQTYSASSASTGPVWNAVGNGSMSAGVGARGAIVAESARAGADRVSYCRRDGRSKAMIDACLKTALGR